MKNKTHARIRSLIPNFRYIATPMVLGLCLAHSATAAITTWTGLTDDNWSTAGNWDNGLPGGNDAVFSDADATGTTGSSGTANNIVDADTTVASLKYTNLDTTGYHTTEIPTGVTLTVNGGGTSIEAQSPTTGLDDVVYATILGDGTLAVNNTAATLYVGQGSGTSNATRRATLDMSGLEEFSATLSQLAVGRQATTSLPNRPQGTLRLARTNTLILSGNPGILLGSISSANGTGTAQLLELGGTNTILSNNGISVGSRKGNGTLRFNDTSVAPGEGSAVFRSLSGTGRQANWVIGDNSTQFSGGSFARGEVNFSVYGEVDALVDNIILGRATSGTTTTSNESRGILTFDSGTIDTNSLTAGIQPNSADPGPANGTVNVDGAGKLSINGDVTLGRYFGTTYNSRGFINIGTISGGGEVTISGNVICGTGTGTATRITLADGSLTLGGNVGDDSLAGDAPLSTLQLNGGTLTFDFGSTPNPTDSRAKVTNLSVPNSVTLDINGSSLSPGTIELIKYTNFDEATQFANLNLTLPLRVVANLINNTANSSVDLNIISVSSNTWSGATNGDWDIDTTVNWKLVPGYTPATYRQPGVPGEPVTFDDTATGTKTVNLTTTLSPGAITVDTASTYTFNGSGAISGPTGIAKRGGGSLVIGNSGTNDFTGGLQIEAGKIQIGSNDRIPLDSTVSLSDVATAELDLNNFNQTLLSLSGGGTSGGNVQLGTGTLTLTGAGSYAGAIQGGGFLVKSGAGNQVLAGASDFTGGTTISGGRITVANASGSGLGSGPVQISLGGELALGNGADTGSIAASTIANDGLVVINRSDDTTLEIEITGTGALTKNGDGTLLIASANSYGGLTTVNGGALQVTDPQALGTAIDMATDRTTINNQPSARLELSGGITLAEPIQLAQKQSASGDAPCLLNVDGDNTLTGPLNLTTGGSFWNLWSDSGKLTISGPVANIATTNTRLLQFFGAGDGEILSDLADGAGSSLTAVVMNAEGIWRLAGNNTLTGATTVEAGTLQIDGTHTASAITVNAFGTLAGTGTLGTVTGFGTIAPGPSIGTLNAGDTNLNGILAIEVSGASSDLLAVTGTLALNTSTVTISGTPVASSYMLATATVEITGAPALETEIPGYELVVDGNSLKLNSTGPATTYASWAAVNAGGQTADLDFDNDGIPNGVEYFMGETGSTFTPNPNLINGQVTWPRDPAAVATFKVQVSDTLALGGWTDILPPHASIDESIPTQVTFTLPTEGPRKFCRLVVTP